MSEVVFRRIRGRIVPMRLTKQQKESAKGGAIAASGAAIAVGGGSAYKRAVNASATIARKAFDAMTPAPKEFSGMKHKFKSTAQMSFDDVIGKASSVNSEKAFKAANRLASLSTTVRRLAPVIGGGLLFYGGAKVIASNRKKKLDPETTALIAATGGASLPYAIKQGQKLFEFGLQNRQTKMAFAKSTAGAAIKKFGSKFFGAAF